MEIKNRIQELLKIPIADVKFSSTFVEIISGVDNIGSIPYYTVAGIKTYDTDMIAVNRLKWNLVYHSNQAEIDGEVYILIGKSNLLITMGTFRRLDVTETNGKFICAVECSYNGCNWDVKN